VSGTHLLLLQQQSLLMRADVLVSTEARVGRDLLRQAESEVAVDIHGYQPALVSFGHQASHSAVTQHW
jgi:hypothetical protein